MSRRRTVLIVSIGLVITSAVVFAGVKGVHITIGGGQDDTAAGDSATVGGDRSSDPANAAFGTVGGDCT